MRPTEYWTAREAAEQLGVSLSYLNYLRTADAEKRGLSRPPYVRFKGRVLYHKTAIQIWATQRNQRAN